MKLQWLLKLAGTLFAVAGIGTASAQFTVPATAGIQKFRLYTFVQHFGSTFPTYYGRFTLRRAASAELIVDGAITTDKLTANAVTAGKIAAGAIETDKLAANAVSADKIAANAITAAKIDTNAITSDKILAGAVTSAKITVSQLDAVSATIGTLRTASTGARTELKDNVYKVFDASNVVRVKIGDLSL